MSSNIMTNMNLDVTYIMSVCYFSYIARKNLLPSGNVQCMVF
jgi:hypothetical protein